MTQTYYRLTAAYFWLFASLLLFATSCASTGPLLSSSSRRPATAKRPTTARTATSKSTKPATPLKTVDSKTYVSRYAREVISQARTYTGTPYRSGGNTYDGIDCSGLICSAFSAVGLQMPRISWQQSEVGHEVEVAEIKPGDLIFFVPDHGKSGYVSHAAIVTEVRGENDIRFIHASSSRGVREDNLYSNYFKGRFVKALRPF
ncbi:C40 family peptidase [Fibrivirga algicola]|uniref:NlpC/P60 family protein n=1 Tax=Fibrivirga algicola TaxID=2950420 RepID=A0ABX0QRW5_9BACT|nr:C40 family peptidase [Fibrivirga algicola]NID13293.1 NlpC/P60 family protein [Fibrivirga algicola]